MCRLGGIVGSRVAAEPFIERMRVIAAANPHGNGIGGFVDGVPRVHRSAASAQHDPGFSLDGFPERTTAVMHDRYATVGLPDPRNSHPFLIGDDLLFAQNGTIANSETLVERHADLIRGYEMASSTDTVRYGTVLHALRERAGGDMVQAWRELLGDIAEHHELSSANALATDVSGDLWAVRWPESRTLYVRRLGARDAADGQRLLGAGGERAATTDSVDGALTVVASQPLDESNAWELIPPGQLLHVRASDLRETMTHVTDAAPRRRPDPDVDLGTTWTWPEPEHWARSEFPHDPDGLRAAIADVGGVATSEQIANGTAPGNMERIEAARRRSEARAARDPARGASTYL